MPWFKVDDNLSFHHKVVMAGNPAMGLWVRAGAMCAQQLTDGFIPQHMADALGTKAQAERLVKVGLWDHAEGGYRFHEWVERQPSRADVEAERAAARDRMRKGRAKRKGVTQEEEPQVDESRSPEHQANFARSSGAVTGEVREPRPSPSPDPVPTRPTSTAVAVRDDHEPTAQSFVAEWIEHCEQRPPGRVIGQVAKELKAMLTEGIEPERVRNGLAEWNRRGLHPSTLASVVHETSERRTRPSSRNQETEDIFSRAAVRMGVIQGGQQ